VFHDTAAEAETEGFRACKRCRPELGYGEGDPQKIAVEKACDLVRKEQDGIDARKWSVKALAMEVGLTESHFCRVFRKVMGMTVGEYRAFLSPGSSEGLAEAFKVDQQQRLDVTHESRESISTTNTLATYGCESSLSLVEFDCTELEEGWHHFAGMRPSVAPFNSSCMDLDIIDWNQWSLDNSSDPTRVAAMDDGFQFFDFDTIGRAELEVLE
jgi:AraC-like DNA-binding protein